MTHEERNLQDYLDGRLSGEARAEFEARLLEDAELAQRVESVREIGAALQEDPVELPPGFYARARERFERSGPGRRGAGFRFLSWEAAGLATAAVLTVALFVPDLFRDSGTRIEPSTVTADDRIEMEGAVEESRAVESGDLGRLEADLADKDDSEVVRRGKNEKKGVFEKSQSQSAPDLPTAPEPIAGRRDLPSVSGEKKAPPVPAEQEYAPVPETLEPQSTNESFGAASGAAPVPADESWVEGDTAPAQAPVQTPPPPAKAAPAAAGKRERAGHRMESGVDGLRLQSVSRPRVVELSEEAGVPGELLVVEDPSDWRAWLEGPAGTALAGLGAPDPARRLVLIAPVGGVDCSTIEVVRENVSYRIRHGSSPTHRPGSAGCAFVLPRDGRPVGGELQKHD